MGAAVAHQSQALPIPQCQPSQETPTTSLAHLPHLCSFQHTLGDPPVAADPPPAADWRSLPPELVQHVASFLDKAQDVLNLSATCKDARCAVQGGGVALACSRHIRAGCCSRQGAGCGCHVERGKHCLTWMLASRLLRHLCEQMHVHIPPLPSPCCDLVRATTAC